MNGALKKSVLRFMIEIMVIAGLVSAGSALASDGDVDYSAPYITVDPATGKLVTVNPGPQLKVHPPTASDGTTPIAADVADENASATRSTMAAGPDQQSGVATAISIIAVVIIAAAVFVFFRIGQRRKIVS